MTDINYLGNQKPLLRSVCNLLDCVLHLKVLFIFFKNQKKLQSEFDTHKINGMCKELLFIECVSGFFHNLFHRKPLRKIKMTWNA